MSIDKIVLVNLANYADGLSKVERSTENQRYWTNSDELTKVPLDLAFTVKEWNQYFTKHIDKIVDIIYDQLIETMPGTRSTRVYLKQQDLLCEKSARKLGFGTAVVNSKTLDTLKPANRQSKLGIFLSPSISSASLSNGFIKLDKYLNNPIIKERNYSTYTNKGLFEYMYGKFNYSFGRNHNQPDHNKNAVNLYLGLESVMTKAWSRAKAKYMRTLITWFKEIGIYDAFKFAAKVWGTNLTIWELNKISDNSEMLLKLKGESPKIITHAVRIGAYLGVSKIELSFLGSVKTSLHERGFTKGAWKLLDRIPQIYMRDYLAHILTSGRNDTERSRRMDFFVNSITWAAQSQIQESNLFKWMMDCTHAYRNSAYQSPFAQLPHVLWQGLPAMQVSTVEEATAFINDYNAKMARLPSLFKAVVEGYSNVADMEQYQARWGQVSDYLSRSETGTWEALPEKLTWSILWKRQEEWHEAINAQERAANNRYSWTSLVKLLEEDDWTAEALDDGGALWEEGKAMHHCVSSYAHYCREGNNRIYSIKRNGDRYATLQIQRVGTAKWSNVQMRGYCNATIKNPFVLSFADSIAEAYGNAERKAMDEANAKKKVA